MIDVENKVFTNVATALRTQFSTLYPNLVIYGEYLPLEKKFPCVYIIEDGNEAYDKSQTLDSRENHAHLTYYIAIYTNDNNKKQTAKKIAAVVDTQMQTMGFTRSDTTISPSYERTIYTLALRYTGVVSKGKTVGTTTTHYVYRR